MAKCMKCKKSANKTKGGMSLCKDCGEAYITAVYTKGIQDTLDRLTYVMKVVGEDEVIRVLKANIWGNTQEPEHATENVCECEECGTDTETVQPVDGQT